MSDEYKQQIREKIKEAINNHIENLKSKNPELLITRQWSIIFPKGFRAGHTVLPVVTTSKMGKYLVGEVQFLLPDSLDIDTDSIELLLKDEPFKPAKISKTTPVPVDQPISILNEIIVNVSDFLQTLNLETVKPGLKKSLPVINNNRGEVNPVKVHESLPSDTTQEIKANMLKSDYLPEWFKAMENQDVKGELLGKLAEGYFHYNRKNNGKVGLREYFNFYTQYLKDNNKLHHYCKYKGKTVSLDHNDFCTESFCSKKPYQAVCPLSTLKFGI